MSFTSFSDFFHRLTRAQARELTNLGVHVRFTLPVIQKDTARASAEKVKREAALKFFWAQAGVVAHSPPNNVKGAFLRKWAIEVQSAASEIDDELESNGRHELWKLLQNQNKNHIREFIAERVVENYYNRD